MARDKGLPSLVPFQLTRWFGDEFRAARPEVMSRLAEMFTANDPDTYEATCAMLGAADLRRVRRRHRAPRDRAGGGGRPGDASGHGP